MEHLAGSERPPLLSLALLAFMLLPGTPAAGQARLLLDDAPGRSRAAKGVAAALQKAASRLDGPGCVKVFEDFRDGAGSPLLAVLDAAGRTPREFLGLLVFVEGYGTARCDSRATLATTSPGSRVVTICSPQFLETQRRFPDFAAALIIHEELHALGLRERPPSSSSITERVVARCELTDDRAGRHR